MNKDDDLVNGWNRKTIWDYSKATGEGMPLMMLPYNQENVRLVTDAIKNKTPIKFKLNKDEII